MIFPIGDTNVRGGAKPFFTYSFILINIVIFILQTTVPGNLVCEFATIPGDIIKGQGFHTLITSMFLHGGWMHLIGNMLFLWVFADNIEAIIGNKRFLWFYILGGLIASGTHIFFDIIFQSGGSIACCMPCAKGSTCTIGDILCQGSVPSLGASGAISAVMGAYIVMFPKSKVKVLILIFTIQVPAIIFLGLWFGGQLMAGVGSLDVVNAQSAGVAWWAHIGGFVFGLIFGFFNRHLTSDLRLVTV